MPTPFMWRVFVAALLAALLAAGCSAYADRSKPAEPGQARHTKTAASSTDSMRPPARPNMIIIMSDDHGAPAIGAYGSRISRTPRLDRLAREGMRFTNCFAMNSLCSPSRATMLTGTTSNINTVIDLSHPLPMDQVTFVELMHAAGYQTAIVGKWHLHRDPTGFDLWDILPEQGEYINPEFIRNGRRSRLSGYVTDIITRKSLDWLRQRSGNQPFLLLCHHKAPHRPWIPAERHAHLFDGIDIPVPETFDDDYATRSDAARRATMTIANDLLAEDLKQPIPAGLSGAALKRWKYERYMKDYLACVAGVDESVGAILDYLDREGLAASTLVVYMSDQGFFLGDHGWYDKRFFYEEALRLPLLVRYPGHIEAGRVESRFAQNLDFAQTFLDYAGVAAPPVMQGASLRPLLQGEPAPHWRTMAYYHYYEDGPPHHVAPHYGVRTARHKLIRFYGSVNAWELYDLDADPHELNNVADDPAHAVIRAELTRALTALRRQYADHDGPEVSEPIPRG